MAYYMQNFLTIGVLVDKAPPFDELKQDLKVRSGSSAHCMALHRRQNVPFSVYI